MARILFVCTGNTCRSPLAERLARARYPEHQWESAGVEPGVTMHPLSAQVLAEHGADGADFFSRRFANLAPALYDHVVLIGERAQRLAQGVSTDRCAVHLWDVADPYDAEGSEKERLAVYRNTADELTRRIDALAALLR